MGSVVIDDVVIRYEETGEGPVVVFVHGVWIAGAVWNSTANHLTGCRVITPTWPLGGHQDPAPSADLSARAVARMIPKFLEALALDDVTIVANDTGGGLTLAALGSGEPGLSRIGKIVLTNCDSYEHFPPKGFDSMIAMMKKSSWLGRRMLGFFASKPGRKMFMKAVCHNPPTPEDALPLFGAFANSKASRDDALRTSVTLEPSVTLEAVDALKAFDRPVLLAWGDSDDLFPLAHAERLQSDFPNATLKVIEGAGAYVMIDRPEELGAAISEFVVS